MKDIPKDRDLKKTEYLLLHGYGESPEVWGNVEGLLKGYQIRPTNLIELFNDPDASRSFEEMASTILKRLTEEGNGSTTIIANSMGGYLALELLRQNPEQFEKLVL
ncbi:MAG: alpha/beta hydrolase, partial [Breznakibacter sp.]|nr:alpha/beta hydrolase [Breznakibacter sp.]